MREPNRTDVYYENGSIKAKGFNLDDQPLPEINPLRP